jgi:hypothetical protein
VRILPTLGGHGLSLYSAILSRNRTIHHVINNDGPTTACGSFWVLENVLGTGVSDK